MDHQASAYLQFTAARRLPIPTQPLVRPRLHRAPKRKALEGRGRRRTAFGANLSGNASYRINVYGKSLKLRGAVKAFESECARGKRFRVVLAAKVTTPGGKPLFSCGVQQPVKRSLCAKGAKEGSLGPIDNGRRP
jgi:hypothetical protein